MLALAFPPVSWSFFAYAALVPAGIWLASRPRSAGASFRFGYATGLVFYALGLHWILFLSKVAVTVSWIMYPAWLAAAGYLALYPALAALLATFVHRRAHVPIAIGWPLAWLGLEWLRAQGELGFPWFHLGYTQWNVLPVLQLATWSGVSAVGVFVALVNGLGIAAVRARGRQRWAFTGAAALVVLAPFVIVRIPPVRDATIPIGLVQGNVPGRIKWSGRHEDKVLSKFMLLSRDARAKGARFILWPETSTGSYLRQNLDQRMRLQAFVDSLGVAILAGYPDYRFTGPKTYLSWNAAGVFWPNTGLGPQYAKIHLVPFGERMPFQGLFPALGKLELGQAEWTPGTDPSPLPTPLGPAGILVCFESIFDNPARAQVLRGATWLVNVTNDEWFDRSGALSQHAAMAVFRAVEHRVPLARCANTGLTFFVDPWGRRTTPPAIFTDAVVVAPLAEASNTHTPFTRYGDTLGPACALACALLVLWALVRSRGNASDDAGALTGEGEAGMVAPSTHARPRRRSR